MTTDRTHWDGCWRDHDECRPSVVDLAAEAAAVRAVESFDAQVYVSGGKKRIEFTGEKFTEWYEAERVALLRVAADRLRAEANRRAPTVWPHGSTFGVEVDVWHHAADLLTEGIDRG